MLMRDEIKLSWGDGLPPLPRPACGERVGVRGLSAQTVRAGFAESPLTRIAFRFAACDPTSPRKRGEVMRTRDAPIQTKLIMP